MTNVGVGILLSLLNAVVGAPADYFALQVVDEATGRGVPLIELRTVDNLRYYTDSAGMVAFNDPSILGREVFFYVEGHGYEFPADGFGFHGQRVQAVAGQTAQFKVKRINVAERLYRVTGEGIYRDSVLLGHQPPIEHPLLNAQVVGSDSVQTAIYHGKLYWFWGDTNRPSYPLGNFHVPGAVSDLPSDGGLDPAAGVNLSYFTNADGFAKPCAQMPGDGPTWIDGVVTIRASSGEEQMFAAYVKVRKFLEVYERGLVRWNDETQQFDHVTKFDMNAPVFPGGHAFNRRVDGVDYVYFANPYPYVRVRATENDIADLSRYEAFTCLKSGGRLRKADKPGVHASGVEVDRDRVGHPRYEWRTDAPAVFNEEQQELVRSNKLKSNELLLTLRDIDTAAPVAAHAGSVSWNPYRQRWVMIGQQHGGTSFLGEIWYAEADGPIGPWVYARKVVTHNKYSFYNPTEHAMFAQEEGRLIYFEGTYSTFFSGVEVATPLYDYNQIMYRLDLDDPRLVLPVAMYRSGDALESPLTGYSKLGGTPRRIAFFALDRAKEGAVPIYQTKRADGTTLLTTAAQQAEQEQPLFYGLPAEGSKAGRATSLLFEYTSADGAKHFYGDDSQEPPQGWRRGEKPICRVWRSPQRLAIDWQ